ncbi:hypothetical protein POVCU1_006660 [Plasmodium ovale curtisi]|uniref:Uncharacterized protein n=1 Tax=Plasmodium ovale curtisi TaxID=864141 RepID=A0A1A8VS89_PLAOA|nr:hypothetical protein POVCU1_006660 [Plasmodium ovale curtisi]
MKTHTREKWPRGTNRIGQTDGDNARTPATAQLHYSCTDTNTDRDTDRDTNTNTDTDTDTNTNTECVCLCLKYSSSTYSTS